MATAFSRFGTKLGGALGNVERTEYDKKIRDGIKQYEDTKTQIEKIAGDTKDTVPNVGGLSNNEKLSQALRQTASLYGASYDVSKAFCLLADILNKVGQEERQLVNELASNCYPNFETFIKQSHPEFKKEKEALDDKALDMDGAKAKNRKSPSDEAAMKEKTATNAFHQQRRTIEGMVNDIPKHDSSQAASMKAYTEAMIKYHTKCAEMLQAAAKGM